MWWMIILLCLLCMAFVASCIQLTVHVVKREADSWDLYQVLTSGICYIGASAYFFTSLLQ